ncbi:MAG: isopentenyl-diphosphate Delta-isomerase [Candidatus Diapherotrites archaeon]
MGVKEELILVDAADQPVGTAEKLEAHRAGKLHRAFSVFVFNSKGEMLLQKRASTKYHSPNLWTNACCGHPRLGETIAQAAHRRLGEEMGFDCTLKELFHYTYKVKLDKGLRENEFLHVLAGKFNGKIAPNAEEAGDWKWEKFDNVVRNAHSDAEQYTPWFKISVNDHEREWRALLKKPLF